MCILRISCIQMQSAVLHTRCFVNMALYFNLTENKGTNKSVQPALESLV